MLLPTSFKLGRQRWTIEYVDKKPTYRGQGCRGLCYFGQHHIQIWRRQRLKMLISTIIHEYLHAVQATYGLKLPHRLIHDLEGPLAALMLLFISGE